MGQVKVVMKRREPFQFGRKLFDKSVTFPPGEQPGLLEVVVSESTASVRFVPAARDRSNYRAHVALLGFDLSTPVHAGENRGRTLRHDFVVLGMQEQQLALQNTALTGELAVHLIMGWRFGSRAAVGKCRCKPLVAGCPAKNKRSTACQMGVAVVVSAW